MYFQPNMFNEMNYAEQQEIIEGMKTHKVEIYLGHGMWNIANNAYDIDPSRSYRIAPFTPLFDIPWILIPEKYTFAGGSTMIPIFGGKGIHIVSFFESEPVYHRRSGEWDEPNHVCTCDGFGCNGDECATSFDISTNVLNISFQNVVDDAYTITERPSNISNECKIETLWKYLDKQFIAIAKDLNDYVYGYTYVPERCHDQWIKKYGKFVDLSDLALNDVMDDLWFNSMLIRNN